MQTSINAAPAAGTDRASIIAGLEALEKAEGAPPAKDTPAPTIEGAPAVDPAAIVVVDPDDDDEAPPAVTPVIEAPDPEAARGLAAVAKQEKRYRGQMAADKAARDADYKAKIAEIAEREQSVAATAKAAKEFTALQERAKRDPLAAIELLRSLGYGNNEFAAVSHASWAETEKGKADPRVRETAEKLAREREVGGGIAALQKRIDDMEAERKAEKEQAATKGYVDNYLDTAMRLAEEGKVTEDDGEGNETVVATVEAPILKRWMKSDRAAARQQLHVVAAEMANRAAREHDPEPTHAEVIAEVEKRKRVELKKLGLDPSKLFAPPAVVAPKKGDPVSKTLGRTGAPPAVVKPKMTKAEEDADIIRRLESGKLDDD